MTFKSIINISCLVSALFVMSCQQDSAKKAPLISSKQMPLASETCSMNSEQWRQWFQTELDRFENSQFTLGGAYISKRMNECQTELSNAAQLGDNFENLRQFTQRFWNALQPEHSLSLDLSDQNYIKSAPITGVQELPSLLNNQEFLNMLDKGSYAAGIAEALDWLTKLNQTLPNERKLIFFPYQSQHLTTIDESQSYGRLFILVPSAAVDVFLQFGLRDKSTDALSNSVSLVALVKENSAGDKLQVPLAYYNDLWRLRSPQGIAMTTRLAQTQTLENCYGCHSSALLPIIPEPMTFDNENFNIALQETSSILAKYALAKAASFAAEAFGPSMGPVNPKHRSPEFIQNCAATEPFSSESIAKISAAMNCSSCHNDNIRRSLRFPMAGFKQMSKDSLVKQFVEVFKSMPPGAELTAVERAAVSRCLSAEYLESFEGKPGLLRQWLNPSE